MSVFIITGVSGSGKSTIGKLLAQRTQGYFFDGDDFHPPENIAKMSIGQALDDVDRIPWLKRLRELVVTQTSKVKPSYIACSALKASYRMLLNNEDKDSEVKFIFLHGSYQLIAQRMRARKEHFMPESLLKSQFEALQIPQNAIVVDISKSPEHLVAELVAQL